MSSMVGPRVAKFNLRGLRNSPGRYEIADQLFGEIKEGVPKWVSAHIFALHETVFFFREDANYVVFGDSGGGEPVAVSLTDGSVWILGEGYGENQYVNSSISLFADSLLAFGASYPYYNDDFTEDDVDSAISRIMSRIFQVDASAVDAEGLNFWPSVLEDFPMGDYSTRMLLDDHGIDSALPEC